MNAICMCEICADGSTQWEMVDPILSRCIEYFATKEEAIEYASANNIDITEWIED